MIIKGNITRNLLLCSSYWMISRSTGARALIFVVGLEKIYAVSTARSKEASKQTKFQAVNDGRRGRLGCDGSVLIDSTKNNTAEKDAPPNQTLRGFGAIERIKRTIEHACPNTVSCADVLAIAARDSVVMSKGPNWPVWLGRRDGRVSIANETKQLPPPTANFTRLTQMFGAKGLSIKDLVVLSAGHTIGTSHCSAFSDRLYNFTGKVNLNDIDPLMDTQYISRMRTRCSLTDNTTLVEMDPGSFKTFDTSYYKFVAKGRGLFHSDASLLANSFTKDYVFKHANGFESEFYQDFADSMISMGNVGVLTGNQGEIRKKCYIINN
ncbi:peroxidase 1-like protein [Carex littledalei]|uniref:Peroxidase n=1 Tax=Carex littledalei TaxID=544730 RepID=A0A833V273_9POAL|nr:peroxidase 1-like protein [Carex littledalei]